MSQQQHHESIDFRKAPIFRRRREHPRYVGFALGFLVAILLMVAFT